ncbi:MAG: ricin-type beta-trefoil lectin domain protein [Moraxella sp.]|nr:ricin-type beta-trefoil lectin domain protein [Moraxella sp.]
MKQIFAMVIGSLMVTGCVITPEMIYSYPDSPNSLPPSKQDNHRSYPNHEKKQERHSSKQSSLIYTHTKQCVDVSGNDNKTLIRYACHGGANQRFVLNHQSIRQGNKCLDVANNAMHDGAPVIAYACHGGRNQEWYQDGNRIRSRLNNKCLDATDIQLKLRTCNNSAAQRFYIQ